MQFQLATANSANGPWSFVGPDGTGNTYYSANQPNVPVAIQGKYHSNQRYLRYKVFLAPTASATPSIDDISILYAQ